MKAVEWLFAFGTLAVITVGLAESGGNTAKASNLLVWTIAGSVVLVKWNDFAAEWNKLTGAPKA